MRLRTFNHARPDLTPYGFTCELWKAAPMRRPDRHDEIELNLLQRGSLTYLLGGSRVTLGEHRLGAFWAALPHQIIGMTGNPHYYVITLPLAWFLQCQLPAKLVDPILSGRFLMDSPGDRFDLDQAMCQQWSADFEETKSRPAPATLLEIQARMLRFADSLPDNSSELHSSAVVDFSGASKAEQMAAFIARHYRDSPSINEVAKAVNLHPNYAMNLFKKTFRRTLNEYLTDYRLAHSQRLLATSDKKIVDVALESGFHTVSRFYAAFQRACRCAPSRYRREHRVSA